MNWLKISWNLEIDRTQMTVGGWRLAVGGWQFAVGSLQ